MSPEWFWEHETPWHLAALLEAHNRANDPKRQEAAARERRKVQIGPDNIDAFTSRLPKRP